MEYWDIYDGNRTLTGRTISRGESLKENEYHIVIHAWIRNSKNEFLIQKRSKYVEKNPEKWSLTSGSVVKGENSYNACIREIHEELGIEPNMTNAKRIFTLKRNSDFCDVWLIDLNIDIENLKLQEKEVEEVQWVTKKEIYKRVYRREFVAYSYIRRFFKEIDKI